MELQDIKFLRSGIKRMIDAGVQHGLRDKQLEAFRAIVSDKFTDQQIAQSYFKLPTGFGKTVMFSIMARAYFDAVKAAGGKRQKIIIIVPRLSLINQTKEKLDKFADVVATEYSSRAKDNKSDIIITTYNSLGKLFGTVDFDDIGLIFADEAHHMLGEKVAQRLSFYNKYVPIIGFTATPEYEINRAVANMLSTEIFAMNIPDSIKSGILSPVKNILYRSSIVCDLSKIPAKTNGEFDYEKIKTKISPDTLATEIARIYAEGFDEDTEIEFRNLKAIVNCPNAEIANLQAAKINEIMGYEAAISLHKVGITDKQYNQMQKDFIDGKYTVACQVGTMTEGFDDVTVSMCINYPTRSRVKAEQTAGRAIRIDENNPNKIAFVVDTIFRSVPNESNKDILYTAAKAQQVLFKDIAGEMVLFPRDFKARRTQSKSPTSRSASNVDFVDFDLITDNTLLVELNNYAQERIANEAIEEKTNDWQAANDLAADKTFPIGDTKVIRIKLEELQSRIPEFIQMRKSLTRTGLCLHRDGRDLFLKFLGFKEYPPKTAEWQSANDLAADKTFPMGNHRIVLKKLEYLQSQMPEYIQIRQLKGKTSLCLHRSGRDIFFEKLGIKEYPPKTDEWQSANDLATDKTFAVGDNKTILKKLEELQSQMPEFIQMRKPRTGGSGSCLCLRRDARKMFLENSGFKQYPPKTEEWLSVTDLKGDQTFPMSKLDTIKKFLEELQAQMPGFIQKRKPKMGPAGLCLHRNGKEEFLKRVQESKNKTIKQSKNVVSAVVGVEETLKTIRSVTKKNTLNK